jgi:hypothetical protein
MTVLPCSVISAAAAIEPSLTFCGLHIFASRDGDRVTGRIEFPDDRPPLPITYRRPDPSQMSKPNSALVPSCLGGSTAPSPRLRAVLAFRDLLSANDMMPKKNTRRELGLLALRGTGLDASYRSLLLWCRKLDVEGESALADLPASSASSASPARGIVVLDSKTASDAVLICAWWSFRIGGIEVVDAPLLRAAASLIDNRQSSIDNRLAAVLKAIDSYYAWPTDRTKFPFKPFKRWVKYDFQKWVYRARDDADYSAGSAARSRRRQAANFATRRAIDGLSEPRPSGSGSTQSTLDNRLSAISPALFPALFPDIARQAAIDQVRAAAPPPDSLTAAVARLADAYRVMLLRAGQGDRDARDQAIATLALWWPSIDHPSRANIDARCDQFLREHPGAARHVPGRKLAMLLAEFRRSLRRHRSIGEVLSKAI